MSTPGILLAILLSIGAAWSIRWLPPLHPVQLWMLPWAIATDLYALRLLPYIRLSWEAGALAAGATAVFAAGALAGERWRKPADEPRLPSVAAAPLIRRAAIITAAATALLLSAFLTQAAMEYGVRNALVPSIALREGITNAQFVLTIKYVYLAIGAVALAAITAGLAPTRRQRRVWLLVAAGCAASTYFATGRGTIVDAAIVGCVAFAVARPGALSKHRVIAGACTIAALGLGVFLVGGSLIGKTFANNADLQQVPNVFARHGALSQLALPYQYASAPIAAFEAQVAVSSEWGDGHGCAMFAEVCSGLRRAGLSVPSIPRVRPFTASPLKWNTYTALDVPLIDGGTALAIPIVGLIGVLTGIIWAAAYRRRTVGLVAYAVASVAIVTSAGSFNFTTPFLVGGFLICLVAIWIARLSTVVGTFSETGPPRRGAPARAVER